MPIYKIKPVCKDYIWGGDNLKKYYNISSDFDRIAETWELSSHSDGVTYLLDEHDNEILPADLISMYGRSILGSKCKSDDFPILIKFIDAEKDLSIQVHPDDSYAFSNENQRGKTEAWVVLDAKPNAFVYCGFTKKLSKEEFKNRIITNTLTDVLNREYVKKGDVVFIPAGTIHAICSGVVIAEIQENSNVTYRVYDYGRVGGDGKPRQLHISKALDVTNRNKYLKNNDYNGHLVECGYFSTDIINAPYIDFCNSESFISVLVIDGSGLISDESNEVSCKKGDSFFIPADSGRYEFKGEFTALLTKL